MKICQLSWLRDDLKCFKRGFLIGSLFSSHHVCDGSPGTCSWLPPGRCPHRLLCRPQNCRQHRPERPSLCWQLVSMCPAAHSLCDDQFFSSRPNVLLFPLQVERLSFVCHSYAAGHLPHVCLSQKAASTSQKEKEEEKDGLTRRRVQWWWRDEGKVRKQRPKCVFFHGLRKRYQRWGKDIHLCVCTSNIHPVSPSRLR